MHNTQFDTTSWYKATTLIERSATLRANDWRRSRAAVDTELAGRRLQRWQSQLPFPNTTYFDQRLTAENLTEEELHHLLGEPEEAIRQRFSETPAWLAQVIQAFSQPPAPHDSQLLSTRGNGKEAAGFLNAIEPLLRQGRARLCQDIQPLIQEQAQLPFDPNTVVDLLFACLPARLLQLLNRTMVLELNVARLQGQLEGDTPEVRFQSFQRRLRDPEVAQALLAEYPVLARQIVTCIAHWHNFSLEFLRHLCADWEEIRGTLSPQADPGLLVELQTTGDTHRCGRSVTIASFSSGFQVVYKPKALAIEAHFQELLAWLNAHGASLSFRTLTILPRAEYGWAEYACTATCSTTAELQRFYRRLGGYLAILYALESTDFHSENLIAAGEHPILADLESLFHPHVEGLWAKHADQQVRDTLLYSVLRIGLLPQCRWVEEEAESVDLSGLGAKAGQITPTRVAYWDASGTDVMHLSRQRMRMYGGHNRPSLNGVEVNVLDYAEDIVDGFTTIYQLLIDHRSELLADDGPLACFADDEIRAILRHTFTYARLLQESYHPDVLRNALDRDRLFDKLWANIEQRPFFAKVIPAERDDLWRGDIPVFTTRPNSRDLWTSTGQRIADFFPEPSQMLARRRMQELSATDLHKQVWFIRASLVTLIMGERQLERRRYSPPPAQDQARYETLLAAARGIGERLEAMSLRAGDDIGWIGVSLINGKHWSLLPLGTDLYDGLSGVALFLAYLGTLSGEERYTELAQATLSSLRRKVERNRPYLTAIGGFNGWGGVIYTLTQIGSLWQQPELLAEAEALTDMLPPLIEQDNQFDILTGTAGCLSSLISLYRHRPQAHIRAIAIQCGEHLLAKAQQMEQGIGWRSPVAESPLAGFSHGAAGIAWALLELAALTDERRFYTAACAAISYERSLFVSEAGNWRDARELDGSAKDHQFMTAWCHGAPGIGLARLRSLKYLDDAATRAEIEVALQTTRALGFDLNHSLCHGALGNVELLLQASETLHTPELRVEVDRIAAVILGSIKQYGWQCGIPRNVESPGLMVGLAGIGYGLLRLAAPACVPSVLTLETRSRLTVDTSD